MAGEDMNISLNYDQFVQKVSDGIYGVRSREDILNTEGFSSIFDEAAKNDEDGNDRVYTANESQILSLIKRAVGFIKEKLHIEDKEIDESKLEQTREEMKTLGNLLEKARTNGVLENITPEDVNRLSLEKLEQKINEEIEKKHIKEETQKTNDLIKEKTKEEQPKYQ